MLGDVVLACEGQYRRGPWGGVAFPRFFAFPLWPLGGDGAVEVGCASRVVVPVVVSMAAMLAV